VSTGGQDLFVVCKNCGSEVSPYITECPYCGNRLRKRAPKLDRDQRPTETKKHRAPTPLLGRLRRNEIPGIAPDRRPYATITLVLLGMIGCVLWRTGVGGMTSNLIIVGKPGTQWWRLFTAAFTYDNTGYAFVSLFAIGLFGWLLERRHGPLVVLVLFLLGGVGGLAAAAGVYALPIVLGAPGAALAMITAWSVPDLLSLSEGREIDGDLIGAAAIAAAVALMPLAAPHAAWVADIVGVIVGLGAGLPLARAVPR
jgi:membrane associated rhomboid family serine protease